MRTTLVAWSAGIDDEIKAMLTSYYAGRISLEDVKSVWSIGDIRQANNTDKIKMRIVAHSSFSGDYIASIPEQSTCKQVILDFDHDTLTTSIGSITKALITIQMYGTLGISVNASAFGIMNTSDTNTGGWASTARRTQCNGNFYNALGFKSQVKQVIKQNCADYKSKTITTTDDYCFLCSEYEVFGKITYAPGQEGTQYKYFENSSNRFKGPGQEGYGQNSSQQQRSVSGKNSKSFCYFGSDGKISYKSAANYLDIVPTCAL